MSSSQPARNEPEATRRQGTPRNAIKFQKSLNYLVFFVIAFNIVVGAVLASLVPSQLVARFIAFMLVPFVLFHRNLLFFLLSFGYSLLYYFCVVLLFDKILSRFSKDVVDV